MNRRHHHSSDYPGYVDEYERWIESMSPEERDELKRLGVDHPDLPSDRANVREKDLADSPLASVEPDIAAEIDHPETCPPGAHADDARSDILASFCARIRSCSNPSLVFDAICFATGISALEGQSATELAEQHGVTKQAFSKVAVQWCETFGLQPSRSMKSKKARRSYRKRAKDFHETRRLTRAKKA